MNVPEGAPVPAEYPDCDPDQTIDQSPTPQAILTQLDEMLAETGGSYLGSGLPIRQQLQYSIIALNRQTHDQLMQIVQVLAANVVGRVQYCEKVLTNLAAPFRRTIRGRIKQQENVVNSLLAQLSNAVCARTAYSQQMLGDCQCKMLGAGEPSTETPMGDGETGTLAQSKYSPDADETWTPSELSTNASKNADIPLSQWLPRVLHDLSIKSNPPAPTQQCCNAQPLVDANNAQWTEIMLALNHPDPDNALRHLFGVEDGMVINPPLIGMEPNAIESEHFPIEELPE